MSLLDSKLDNSVSLRLLLILECEFVFNLEFLMVLGVSKLEAGVRSPHSFVAHSSLYMPMPSCLRQ